MLTTAICDDHDYSTVTFRCVRCGAHRVDVGPQVNSPTPAYRDEPFGFRRQWVVVADEAGVHCREIQTGGLYDGWLFLDDPTKRVQPVPQSVLSGRFDDVRDAFADAARRLGELAAGVASTAAAVRAAGIGVGRQASAAHYIDKDRP